MAVNEGPQNLDKNETSGRGEIFVR